MGGHEPLLAPVVLGKRRVFCCHRATLSRRHRPNSLAAVTECVEAGVPRLEIDVRFLSDDGMLVFHDAHLDAETIGEGPVHALDTAAARRLRYRADETALCFLEDVADAVRGSATLLQVDLKLMRPMVPSRVAALARALAPIRDQALVGSLAHWNLRRLAAAGLRVALDTTFQWHHSARRMEGDGLNPVTLGVHGLWDDSPIAANPRASAGEYLAERVEDLLTLAPASEWMVDYGTLLHMASLGLSLGETLAARGVDLAAWTLTDDGDRSTTPLLRSVLETGAATIITDDPAALAQYAARIG